MPSDPRNDRSRFNLRVLDGGRAGGAAEPVREPRRRVIVVDDEELSRALFVSVLGKLGSPLIEVSAFAAPEPALEFARAHAVALGLVDLHLGRGHMSGLELVDRIRREGAAGSDFAAILITADTEPMVVYEATRHAVPAVMEKAVDLYRLALRCSALLGLPPPGSL